MELENGQNTKFLGLTKSSFVFVATILAAISVACSVVSLVVVNQVASRAARIASDARVSDCAQKANAQEAVAQTTKYLDKNPGPEPIPGIKRAELENSLTRQKNFLAAFAATDCPND